MESINDQEQATAQELINKFEESLNIFRDLCKEEEELAEYFNNKKKEHRYDIPVSVYHLNVAHQKKNRKKEVDKELIRLSVHIKDIETELIETMGMIGISAVDYSSDGIKSTIQIKDGSLYITG